LGKASGSTLDFWLFIGSDETDGRHEKTRPVARDRESLAVSGPVGRWPATPKRSAFLSSICSPYCPRPGWHSLNAEQGPKPRTRWA